MDLPYRAEYAKSNRAGCRGCKITIEKGELRLAVMVQSPKFDSKVPQWYHLKCFFKKQRPKTADDIEHLESLRVEDQDKIKSHVGVSAAAIVPDKKGKKRTGDAALKNAALKDYIVEYAKSGRAMCRGCEQKILKDEIRISKKDFDSDVGKKYGGQDMWHHVSCFAQIRSELGYFENGDKLPGFKSLKHEDQATVKKQIPAIKQEDLPDVKKMKTEDSEPDPKEEEYREQNKIMFRYRDQLSDQLDAKEYDELLDYNKQQPSKGKDSMLDQLADVMTFGALKPCSKCKGGQFTFNKIGYVCTGNLTEWTKCPNIEKEPKRVPFKVPSSFQEMYPFLKAYKYVPRKRVVREVHSSTSVKKDVKEEEQSEPKVKRALPPLYDMEFVILGHPPKGKDKIKKLVTSMGGKVTTKITDSVMAVISTEEEVEKLGARMQDVERCQIHVVPDDFLDEAKDNVGKIPDLILKKSLCNWGADPTNRLPPEPSTSNKSKSRSIYTKSVPGKVKLKLKGGGAVDPESGLEDVAHVYQDGDVKYTVTLGLTEIQSKKNSYYKLQLLAGDNTNRYWLFRSWGRIGTTIGSNKLEPMTTLQDAKREFMALYEEKTGNYWENHNFFVKVPGRMYPIDVDYGEAEQINLDIVEAESQLPKPVQDLMRLIFDVNSMKKLMAEFELDTEKMPLGKLSSAQINKAFGVLSELQQLIDAGNPDEMRLLDASNRFYTFIPHSFGIEDPPILRDPEVIKQKLEMLDSLREMEIAYNLMKSSGSEHTVDSYYKQLNTEIGVLDRESEEFAIIHEYVTNTHAATHSSYTLEIEDVYIVKREGEDKRFKPFRKLHNHKLLWHGSRVTNFAGILSQGLRIAPPEAPVTGYMFGKGVYFADMVSKSANYCSTNVTAPTGLLLLCDVALGNMYELFHSKYIEKLPKGKHSTKGVGQTEPDPTGVKTLHGIEVPAGKGVRNSSITSASLLYNEYIIYDVAQVNVKYLLKVNFKYNY